MRHAAPLLRPIKSQRGGSGCVFSELIFVPYPTTSNHSIFSIGAYSGTQPPLPEWQRVWDNMDDSGQTYALLKGAPSLCPASEPHGLQKEDGASAILLGALQSVKTSQGNVEKCPEQDGTHGSAPISSSTGWGCQPLVRVTVTKAEGRVGSWTTVLFKVD